MKVAAGQFPVSADLDRNARYVERQARRAADAGARVVVFPETALCGYAPRHIPDLARFSWSTLAECQLKIEDVAASLGIWVIVGSMRRTGSRRPTICLHVIDDTGAIAATYDKQRLYGREAELFRPGKKGVVVDIDGHRCGFLVCYDNCFPELYTAYRECGVELLFHAFCNAANPTVTPVREIMRGNLVTRAADHGMWIVASNSTERYSPMPAAIARPDGTLKAARRHVPGIVVDDYPSALGWTYDNRAWRRTGTRRSATMSGPGADR